MNTQEIRNFIRQNIESFAGSKATMQGNVFGSKFQLSGMLSSTWQGFIPVCTVRTTDKNNASISIPIKKIKNITRTSKTFDDADLLKLGIDLESRDFYSHTTKKRIVFDIELKTGEKVELWINPSEKYASVDNIIAKVEGRIKDVVEY